MIASDYINRGTVAVRRLSAIAGFANYHADCARLSGVPSEWVLYLRRKTLCRLTDHHSKLKDDLEFRKPLSVRVGLGFLPSAKPSNGPNVPKSESESFAEMAISA